VERASFPSRPNLIIFVMYSTSPNLSVSNMFSAQFFFCSITVMATLLAGVKIHFFQCDCWCLGCATLAVTRGTY
jgi:hypothetical protein